MNIHFKDGKPFGNPEEEPKVIEDCHGSGILYDCAMEDWQSSSIAIKEPEWKYADVVFDRDCNSYRIGKINKDKTIMVIGINKAIKETFKEEDLSHYYEGQQISRGKFRLVKRLEEENIFNTHLSESEPSASNEGRPNQSEWQEVKEPPEYIGHEIPENINREYAKHQGDVQKGLIVLEQFKF